MGQDIRGKMVLENLEESGIYTCFHIIGRIRVNELYLLGIYGNKRQEAA